jgi:hypothetical protein
VEGYSDSLYEPTLKVLGLWKASGASPTPSYFFSAKSIAKPFSFMVEKHG